MNNTDKLHKLIQKRQAGTNSRGKPRLVDVFPLVNDPLSFSLHALSGVKFGAEYNQNSDYKNSLYDNPFIVSVFYSDDPTLYTLCLVTLRDFGKYLKIGKQKEDSNHIAYLCQVNAEEFHNFSGNEARSLYDMIATMNSNAEVKIVLENFPIYFVGDQTYSKEIIADNPRAEYSPIKTVRLGPAWKLIQGYFMREYNKLQRSNILVRNIPEPVLINTPVNVPHVTNSPVNTPVKLYAPGPAKANAVKANTPKPVLHKVLPGSYTHTKVGNNWHVTHTPSKGGRRKRTKRSKRSKRRYTTKQ